MSTEFWTIVGGIATMFASNYFTYFFTRKKYNSEVDGNVIENMQKSLDFYTKLSDDNKQRLEEALIECRNVKQENDELKAEIKDIKNRMYNLMESICMDLTCSMRQKMPREQRIHKTAKKNVSRTSKTNKKNAGNNTTETTGKQDN